MEPPRGAPFGYHAFLHFGRKVPCKELRVEVSGRIAAGLLCRGFGPWCWRAP